MLLPSRGQPSFRLSPPATNQADQNDSHPEPNRGAPRSRRPLHAHNHRAIRLLWPSAFESSSLLLPSLIRGIGLAWHGVTARSGCSWNYGCVHAGMPLVDSRTNFFELMRHQIIFASICERIFFDSKPSRLSILGTMIILSSALYVAVSLVFTLAASITDIRCSCRNLKVLPWKGNRYSRRPVSHRWTLLIMYKVIH